MHKDNSQNLAAPINLLNLNVSKVLVTKMK